MKAHWTSGNTIELLENGEDFFPAVNEAINEATHSVIIETFIIFDDKVGQALQQVVIGAAQRGVQVDIAVDGYGTADLPPDFIEAMTSAGVRFHVFDPQPRLLGMRTNLFRRLHRKIVVVDDAIAFVGGINFGADHLADFGPTAKQDYAISIKGALVKEIAHFEAQVLAPVKPERRSWRRRRRQPERRATSAAPASEGCSAALVVRDNDEHNNDIELHYRMGIRAAKDYVTIANAYFFPGYRLLRDLRGAAQRGVKVRLILQGEPDMPAARFVATMLYDYLLSAGVEIYEYCERPLHGKVAVVDDAWSTVGSSNLDPLSLALNLEANVMILDRDFSRHLQSRLDKLIDDHCKQMLRDTQPRRKIQRVVLGVFVFHFLRRFPSWASWLPARKTRLLSMPPEQAKAAAPAADSDAAADTHDKRGHHAVLQWARARWPILRRILAGGFIALIVVLLGLAATRVKWDEVLQAIGDTSSRALLFAFALTLASYLTYACFDLVGKWYTGHTLTRLRTFVIGITSYAFIMTLGSSVGGLGLRLRLYTKSGLSPGKATRIFGLGVVTNWAGYGLLAGAIFAAGGVSLPTDWGFGTGALRGLGAVMMLLSLCYAGACFCSRKRSWTLRGHHIELPSGKIALVQLGLSTLNWSLMGAVLYVLLPDGPGYLLVLGVVLLSAIAGLIARVPAGLGVLEAMAVAVLSANDDVTHSTVLAATLVYRAVYYLSPLFIAGLWYLLMEARMKEQTGSQQKNPGTDMPGG